MLVQLMPVVRRVFFYFMNKVSINYLNTSIQLYISRFTNIKNYLFYFSLYTNKEKNPYIFLHSIITLNLRFRWIRLIFSF